VDPEFQRVLTIVLVAGAIIFGGGAVILFLVFRRFEGPTAGGQSHMALIAGLVAFLLLACLLLFVASYRW
jgi:hypothetical protein